MADLERPRVADLREAGIPILTWTVTRQDQAAQVRELCDNITFEGFAPPVPT